MERILARNPDCFASYGESDGFYMISVGMYAGGLHINTTIDADSARRFARDLQVAADRMDAKLNASAAKEIESCAKTMAA